MGSFISNATNNVVLIYFFQRFGGNWDAKKAIIFWKLMFMTSLSGDEDFSGRFLKECSRARAGQSK